MPPVAILGRSLARGNTGAKSGEGAKAFTSGSVLAQPPNAPNKSIPAKKAPNKPKVFCVPVDLDDRAKMVFMKMVR